MSDTKSAKKDRERLYQLFDSNIYDSRYGASPGFSIQRRFLTIGSHGGSYRKLKWALDVIARYRQALKHGHVAQFPREPEQFHSPMKGRKRYAGEMRSVRTARELAAKERKRLSSKAYEKERQRDYSRPKKGRINPRKMGRKPASALLLNKQRRDPAYYKLRNERDARNKRARHAKRKSLRS